MNLRLSCSVVPADAGGGTEVPPTVVVLGTERNVRRFLLSVAGATRSARPLSAGLALASVVERLPVEERREVVLEGGVDAGRAAKPDTGPVLKVDVDQEGLVIPLDDGRPLHTADPTPTGRRTMPVSQVLERKCNYSGLAHDDSLYPESPMPGHNVQTVSLQGHS